MSDRLKRIFVILAWVQAFIATFGSLYFSEILRLSPCSLCWYQRTMMYPLVLILAVGLLRKDLRVAAYALPLSLIGLGVSIYHNLLYYNVIPEQVRVCTAGISCTIVQIKWLGFVTIPLLALIAFSNISALLLSSLRSKKPTA